MKYVALRAIKGDVPKNENTVFNAQQIKDIHPDQAPELRQPVKPVNSPTPKTEETEIETIIEDVEEDMNNVPDEPPVDTAAQSNKKNNKTFKITQDPSKKDKKKHKWCNLL